MDKKAHEEIMKDEGLKESTQALMRWGTILIIIKKFKNTIKIEVRSITRFKNTYKHRGTQYNALQKHYENRGTQYDVLQKHY